jgi:gamma-glutamyl hydrolase
MFSLYSPEAMKWIQEEPLTMNHHKYGIELATFTSNSNLNTFYKILSTNTDRNGKEFVSSMESGASLIFIITIFSLPFSIPTFSLLSPLPSLSLPLGIHYPFYGVQWHPEKNIFEWTTNEPINHSFHGVYIAQSLANLLLQEARKNSHSFTTQDEEFNSLIYNYQTIFTGWKSNFDQIYYF